MTTTSGGQLSGLAAAVLVETVAVGSQDEHLSMMVEGADRPLRVQILDPAGLLLASGDALLEDEDGAVSGADTAVAAAGVYTVQVIDLGGGSPADVEVSIARTVSVN